MWATTYKGCTNQDVFFFPCLPSPPLRCLSVFSLISPLYFSLNFDIRTFPRMSVTNCSPTLWQCFCSPKPLYELPVFVSFFLFFPSRSGAPDVKPPRYGVYWFAFPSQPPDHNISPSPEIILANCAALIFPLLFFHILAYSFLLPVMLCSLLTQFLSVKPLSWPLTELLEHHLWPLQFFAKVMHLCS